MIQFKHTGDFSKTEKFLNFIKGRQYLNKLSECGEEGKSALAAATPKRTGTTAAAWTYEMETGGQGASVTWCNNNIQHGLNIAVLLDKGHGTGTGGYVAPRNYIEPAIQPVMEKYEEEIWREVKQA